ncbi:MAG: 4-(cytidine 5'-diphospho)-2-C-methyl-D-erythritol kinase [Bacteroidota bacterium]
MLSFPNAKINLGLFITRKRRDGFHEIESVFYPVPWRDALEIIEADKTKFTSSGLSIPGDPKDNLVLKAYELLRKDFQLEPVQIHLHKIIPMGAGLGGGSADAAFALQMVNELFQLYLDDSFLEEYAARLGSDCPFFVSNKPVLATGRGTDFTDISLNLSGTHLVLVNPGIHVGTKEAYANVKPKAAPANLKEVVENQPIAEWKDLVHNDFEDSIFPNHPELAQLKETMYESGATYAAMTGSGSTVFGLFDAAASIPELPSHYQIWQGTL